MQWNCRSAISNKENLEVLLHENEATVALLSETWFKPGKYYNFTGYNTIRTDRDDGYGGVAILVKSNKNYKEIQLQNTPPIDVTCISIPALPHNKHLHLVSVYVKPRTHINVLQWTNFFNSIPKPFLLTGDFNAHNISWGCEFNDSFGKTLCEAINQCNLVYLNDGSPTFVNLGRNIAIDLSVCSQDIIQYMTWTVIDDPHGSNHLPIIMTLEYSQTYTKTPSAGHNIWSQKQADWNLYYSILESRPTAQSYSELIANINAAAEKAIPKKSTNPNSHRNHFPKLWWNNTCSIAARRRREAYAIYKTNPNVQNLVEFKRLDAIAKRTFKQTKRRNWIDYCESLNQYTPITEIWKKVNIFKNRKQQNKLPIDKDANWIEEFHNKLTPDSVEKEPKDTNPIVCVPRNNTHLLKPFKMWELIRALKQTNTSSPGKDNVSYSMLSNIPIEHKISLLNIYNEVWSGNTTIPESWKEYIVLPIKKQGKPLDHPNSYRPISLASCILKTFERLIKNRLEHWLEKENILPNSQYGFRKSRSTIEAITALITDILTQFTGKSITIATFIDLTAAFDNIDLDTLHSKLNSIGIPTHLSLLLVSLYTNRRIHLKINQNITSPRNTSQGLPQGSILSPLLYILYTIDLENYINDTKIIQFADDIVVYTSDKTMTSCQNKLSNSIQSIHDWCLENNMTISETKTEVCVFTRKRDVPQGHMQLGPYRLPIKNTVKYLGLYLDRKLLWKDCIHQIVKKSENAINILRAFCHTKWGADPNIALTFYKSLVRSILDYGSHLYGSAKNIHLKKIESQKNKCLRISLGYLKSTPINIMEAEAIESPLKFRRQQISHKIIAKATSKNADYLSAIHNLSILVLTHQYWQNKATPLFVESYTTLSNYRNIIYSSRTLPCYSEEPEVLYSKKIQTHQSDPKDIFQETVNINWPGHQYIYTDGSKTEHHTGCAFYESNTNHFEKYELPRESSIYTAELTAVCQAMKYILHKSIKNKHVIFTDSKSTVDRIKNLHTTMNLTHIEAEILKLNFYIIEQGKTVLVVWIKGHSGIKGNETADQLAKSAQNTGYRPTEKCIPVTDLNAIFKKYMKALWEEKYRTSVTGQSFVKCQNKLPAVKWFRATCRRSFITVINRIRSQHALTPCYQYRIGIAENPSCTCGERGDLTHMILECNIFKDSINILYTDLIRYEIPLPVSLDQIIFCNNNDVYFSIYQHVIRCKMKL